MDSNEQKLIEYIKSQLKNNVDKGTVVSLLTEAGWTDSQINDAFNQVENNLISPAGSDLQQTENVNDQTPIYSQDAHVVVNNEPDLHKDEKRIFRPKLIFISLILMILIIIAASVYYGYFYLYLAPERVLAQSTQQMQTVQSYDYSGSLLLKISGDLFSGDENMSEFLAYSLFIPREFGLRFSGSMDYYNQDEIKTSTLLNVDVNSTEVAEMQTISIGDISYLKLNRFNLVPMQNVLNNWLLLDVKEISQTYGLEYDQDQKVDISHDDNEKLIRSLLANNPLEIVEDLGVDTIDGKRTFHYKYKINKEKLKVFITDTVEVLKQLPDYEEIEIDEVNSMLDEIEFFDGEMWIGKDDYFLYGISGGMIFEIPDSDVKTEVIFDLRFDEYNIPKEITPPSDHMTLEQFGEVLMKDLQIMIPYDEMMEMDSNLQPDDIGSFLRAYDLSQPSELGVSDGF